jgi:5'-deoxynucleotidase YfbR-like HD superfamily hydrolase
VIKQQYEQQLPWIPALIEQYERREDPESRFVYAADKLMGAITTMAGDGARWHEYFNADDGSDYHVVVARLRRKAELFPQILDIFDAAHQELNVRRLTYPR